MGWPGLGKEVADICHELQIPDINDNDISAKDVKEAVIDHHYRWMTKELRKLEPSQKLFSIKYDSFKQVQEYFMDKSVDNGRMAFQIRAQMLPGIPANFKNNYRTRNTDNPDAGLFCEFCQAGEIFSQSHCAVCPAWDGQRMGLDLSKVEDLVTFFRRMLVEREKRTQSD